MEQFQYPVERLLADPSPLLYLEEVWGIPFDALSNAFYIVFERLDPEKFMDPENSFALFFLMEEEYGDFEVSIGETKILFKKKGENHDFPLGDPEVYSSMEIHRKIFQEINKVLPEDWKDNFALVDIPTSNNNWLVNDEDDTWEGFIYKQDDPGVKMSFIVSYDGDFHVRLG